MSSAFYCNEPVAWAAMRWLMFILSPAFPYRRVWRTCCARWEPSLPASVLPRSPSGDCKVPDVTVHDLAGASPLHSSMSLLNRRLLPHVAFLSHHGCCTCTCTCSVTFAVIICSSYNLPQYGFARAVFLSFEWLHVVDRIHIYRMSDVVRGCLCVSK